MNNKISVHNRLFIFIPKGMVVGGIAIVILSLTADLLGVGTSGFRFGRSQIAMMSIGLSIIVWSVILRVKLLFKRFLYSAIFAVGCFLLWSFWFYPVSGYEWNIIRPQPIFQRVLITSHLAMLCFSVLSARSAFFTAKRALGEPSQRENFIIGLKKFSFSLGLFVFSLILGAIGVEFMSAAIVPPWPVRELRPVTYNSSDERVNSWGFLDAERNIQKPPGNKRIIFLGDSFLESGYYSRSLSHYVHDELVQQGKTNIECVNLGVSATGPQHYLYRMRNFGIKLSPDMVLLFIYIGNDLVSIAYQDQLVKLIAERPLPSVLGTFMPRFTWFLVERFHLSEHESGNIPIPNESKTLQRISEMPYESGTSALAEHMHQYYFPDIPGTQIKEVLRRGGPAFWQELEPRETDRQYLQGWLIKWMIEQGLQVRQKRGTPLAFEPDQVTIQATVSYIEQIKRDLQKRNMPLVVFLIPFAENVDPEYRSFWLPWYQDNEYAPWLRVQRKTLFKVLNGRGIKTVDLTEVLNDISGIYRKFDGHWTEKGHLIVAHHVVQIITSLNLQ